MDSDDRQVGIILTRRQVLALLGTTGAAALVACVSGQSSNPQPTSSNAAAPTGNVEAKTAMAIGGNSTALAEKTTAQASASTAPQCVVRPQVTEGPYYVVEDLMRSDIRSDPGTGAVKPGVPLELTFAVSDMSGQSCKPLHGAIIDVWHCDATGVYSDVSDPGFNTKGQKFLRGSQTTDANGVARFTTIYPGWYRGRAVHIHFKVHPDANSVFTSQLFFDDTLSDQVFTQAPYASRGQRDTLNRTDSIYQGALLLAVDKTAQGYAATFTIGIDRSTLGTAPPGGPGGPGGGPPPPGGTPPPSG